MPERLKSATARMEKDKEVREACFRIYNEHIAELFGFESRVAAEQVNRLHAGTAGIGCTTRGTRADRSSGKAH